MKFKILFIALNIPFACCAWFNLPAQSKPSKIIQANFVAQEGKDAQVNAANQESLAAIYELLEFYAQLGQHRKLTMEEMDAVMQVLVLLFLDSSLNFSRQVEIMLPSGSKITLPFSSQMFAALNGVEMTSSNQDQAASSDQQQSQESSTTQSE